MDARTNDKLDGSKILFVEAETREHEALTEKCTRRCQIHSHRQRLQELADSEIPADTCMLSTFIHSCVDRYQLDRLPKLRLIATRSTGFDHIDIAASRERGIAVCNVPDYGEDTVAEHTFAMLLALSRKIHRCYERTTRGDFSIDGLRGEDLADKTFGCLGVGKIGLRVLRIANGFGMRLLGCDVEHNMVLAGEIGFEYVDMDQLLCESDVLSIHIPYNSQTHHLIDAAALAKLPGGAILVNTARGGIVDSQALIDALRNGHLGGAALDVLEAEAAIAEEADILSSSYDAETLKTIVRNHALLRMPNVIITPHVAFNSRQAVQRIIETTIQNIHAFLAGRPQNVVNEVPISGRM